MTTTPLTAPTYRLTDWQRGYESLHHEYSYPIESIEGDIPADLHGTLFRNGPGRLDINGMPFQHPFDGDGMVCAITFNAGKAHFRNRFVRTEGFVAESAAGKILYRGVFGTQKPGGWLANAFDLNPKNIANTGILYWGDRLLALWEGGLPHELNPATLDTLGTSTLGGILAPTDAWSAHPRIDPGAPGQDPVLVNFSLKTGLSTQVTVQELNPDGQLRQQKTFRVPGFAFIHDFVMTPSYYVFFQNPVVLNPFPFVLGLRGAGQCLSFQSHQPTRLWVVPRGSGPVQTFETVPCFVFHHANAYEVDNTLVIDSICYANFPSLEPDTDFRQVDFAQLPEGQLWRFRVALGDRHLSPITPEVLTAQCCEFPTLHPHRVGRPYRFVTMGTAHAPSGNAPLQAITQLDLVEGSQTRWSATPKGFVSEPIFVPKPNAAAENDGWILVLVYDSSHHRTDVVILDGTAIAQGPMARLHLTHHVPYGLHGSFVPQVF